MAPFIRTELLQDGWLSSATQVSHLIAQVYVTAPVAEQSSLLEHLLKPLGVLSLAAVANGVFAQMLFRSGSRIFSIGHEDAQNVRVDDVVALVEHVLQVSAESVESLFHLHDLRGDDRLSRSGAMA